MKYIVPKLLFLVLLLISTGCNKEKELTDFECFNIVEKKSNRIIGYDILDLTEKGDFVMNHEIASSKLKSEFIQLLQP
jgi:hypothetical protein